MPSENVNETEEPYSHDSANRELELLMQHYRDTALWFMKPNVCVDISDMAADAILDKIAEKSPRSTWYTIRKLKKWRLQNSR